MKWVTLSLVIMSLLLVSACTPAFHSASGVPRPGATMPYGLLVLDMELGDTTGAELVFTATGYVTRRVKVRADGVIVLRMNRGEWTVQLEGRPGKATVATFNDKKPTKRSGSKLGIKQWPTSPYRVTIQRNKLTSGGRICAHAGCTAQWTDFDDPLFDDWMRADRLLLTTPVFGVPEEEKTDEETVSDEGAES